MGSFSHCCPPDCTYCTTVVGGMYDVRFENIFIEHETHFIFDQSKNRCQPKKSSCRGVGPSADSHARQAVAAAAMRDGLILIISKCDLEATEITWQVPAA